MTKKAKLKLEIKRAKTQLKIDQYERGINESRDPVAKGIMVELWHLHKELYKRYDSRTDHTSDPN